MKSDSAPAADLLEAKARLKKNRARMRRVILRSLKSSVYGCTLPFALFLFFFLSAFFRPTPSEWTTVTEGYQSCEVSHFHRSYVLKIFTTDGNVYRLGGSPIMSFSEIESALKPGEMLTITYFPWFFGNVITALRSGDTEYLSITSGIRSCQSDVSGGYIVSGILGGITLGNVLLSFYIDRKDLKSCRVLIRRYKQKLRK